MHVLEIIKFTNGAEHTPAGFFRNILRVAEHARDGRQRYSGSSGHFAHGVGHIVVLYQIPEDSGLRVNLPQLPTCPNGNPITTMRERPRGLTRPTPSDSVVPVSETGFMKAFGDVRDSFSRILLDCHSPFFATPRPARL